MKRNSFSSTLRFLSLRKASSVAVNAPFEDALLLVLLVEVPLFLVVELLFVVFGLAAGLGAAALGAEVAGLGAVAGLATVA